ncbi:VOC family protein [Pseudoalteromonas sp. MMG010]|uniref:VOC family protein n=1 Tax=Pseudoalteromonas sp. MMG010 TaxID=2822685 RepID=UPI001B39FD8E|nr:VOC family protein [Pseudoalteromonas sp. MMG010]MBQ4833595.1 VOC family protein [Pseudoalteromonas sp. MMG010]
MHEHEKLNYVEFAAENLPATKQFFSQVFNWHFSDYGDQYIAFEGQGLNGGFYYAPLKSTFERGGALLVFYSNNIVETMDKVIAYNGEIIEPIFEFPGGCRFHFLEPSGNEFAVWSENQ